jgi:hypothetical protein
MGKTLILSSLKKMGFAKKRPLGSFGKWWAFLYLMAIQNFKKTISLLKAILRE